MTLIGAGEKGGTAEPNLFSFFSEVKPIASDAQKNSVFFFFFVTGTMRKPSRQVY